MLSQSKVMEIMRDSLGSLRRSGLIEVDIVLDDDTVLLGDGSPLDSVGFVTFISDVEERLCHATGKELAVTLFDVGSFNENDPFISAATFARYLSELSAG